MKKIIERRYITPYDLRKLCVKEEWYTKGDNEEYNLMLGMCYADGFEYAELTTDLIAEIAADIQKHSDVDQDEESLLNIMFCIANEASTTCFEIKEYDLHTCDCCGRSFDYNKEGFHDSIDGTYLCGKCAAE